MLCQKKCTMVMLRTLRRPISHIVHTIWHRTYDMTRTCGQSLWIGHIIAAIHVVRPQSYRMCDLHSWIATQLLSSSNEAIGVQTTETTHSSHWWCHLFNYASPRLNKFYQTAVLTLLTFKDRMTPRHLNHEFHLLTTIQASKDIQSCHLPFIACSSATLWEQFRVHRLYYGTLPGTWLT